MLSFTPFFISHDALWGFAAGARFAATLKLSLGFWGLTVLLCE